jgi:hypothetical protein
MDHTMGELSSNRRSVTFVIPLLELESLAENGTLLVKWRE